MRDPLLERTLPCRDLAQQRVRRDLQIVLGVVHPADAYARVPLAAICCSVSSAARASVNWPRADSAMPRAYCPMAREYGRSAGGSGMASTSSQRPKVTKVR